MNISVQAFANCILTHVKENGNIPHIVVDSDTTFGYIIDLLKQTVTVKGGDDQTAILETVKEFEDAMGQEFMKVNVFTELDTINRSFADRIRTAFDDLKRCKDMVIEMSKRFDKTFDLSIAQDPFLSKYYGKDLSEIQLGYPLIDWSVIETAGPEKDTVLRVNNYSMALKGADVTNTSALTQAIQQVRYAVENKSVDAPITAETFERLVEAIKANPKLASSDDHIRATLRLLTVKSSFVLSMIDILTNASSLTSTGTKLPDFMSRLTYLFNVAAAVDSFELSTETKDKLRVNAELMLKVVDIMTYFVVHCRRVVFADTIMLPSGQVNTDNKDAYEDKGGTMLMLAHHISTFYKNNILRHSNTGITVKAVIENAPKVKENVEKDVRDLDQRIKLTVGKLRAQIFVNTALTYLNETTDANRVMKVPMSHASAVIKAASESLIHGTALEDALYNVIFKVYYPNEFVSVMFNRLGVKYLKLVSTHNEISEKNLKLIEVSVIAQLITEFIIKVGLMKIDMRASA